MTTTVTATDRLTIVKLLAGGRDIPFVAAATGHETDTVANIASSHGYPDTHKLKWAADTIALKIDADARAAIPAATTAGPTAPAMQPARSDPVAQLLADAAASKRKRTRDLGVRAAKTLDLVRAELAAEAERDSAAFARAEAERKVRAEVQRLEARLADLKRGLSHSTAVPAAAGALGLDPKAIRAWAKATGVPCTVTGRVPRAVVEQYQDAHRGAA